MFINEFFDIVQMLLGATDDILIIDDFDYYPEENLELITDPDIIKEI